MSNDSRYHTPNWPPVAELTRAERVGYAATVIAVVLITIAAALVFGPAM